ncbi:MAG: hypothetical protein WBC44_10660 [Planctomycetaceae bacterium]
MSDSILELDAALREKEELITALTERLELTAEQLDRLQRTNGDRGHWLAGGMPAQLVEQQQSLCGGLERLLEQWEAAQPNLALERIESQLSDLRQLLSSHTGDDAVSRPSPVCRKPAADRSESVASSHFGDAPGWEALKAELLSQEPSAENRVDPVTIPEPIVAAEADPFGEEPLQAPALIELESASRDELCDAVRERDEFIIELSKRYRAVEGRTRPGDGWKAFDGLPDELRARVESLERRLEQMLRLGEVELSLERAKLCREAARLRQMEAGASKTTERFVAAGHDHVADDEQSPGSSREGRWLRVLGIARDK